MKDSRKALMEHLPLLSSLLLLVHAQWDSLEEGDQPISYAEKTYGRLIQAFRIRHSSDVIGAQLLSMARS